MSQGHYERGNSMKSQGYCEERGGGRSLIVWCDHAKVYSGKYV